MVVAGEGKVVGVPKFHSWGKCTINEIPTVPIYYLAKPQPREWAWQNQRGKKTLLSLTLVRLCMPLTNINSDWMSNASSGLCIIYLFSYAGPLFRILGCNYKV